MAGETPQNISEPVIAALAGATKDPDREVRELAVAALGRAGPVAKSSEATLEDALEDKEESVQVSAALALEKIDPESIRYKRVILKALAAGNGPVFLAVGRMRPQAKWSVPTLSKLLSHPEVGIRALAARTLGQIGVAAADAEPALNRALHDDNPAVRRAAEQALGKIRPERAAVH
jgi:HEAT repeat protein